MQSPQKLPSALDFQAILDNILNPDNNIRKKAESAYKELKQNPDFLLRSLVACFRDAKTPQVKMLAPILLKRLINAESNIFGACSQETRNFVQSESFNALGAEQENVIRHKLELAVSAIISYYIQDGSNNWTKFIPTLYDWIKKGSSKLQEASLNIFQIIIPSFSIPDGSRDKETMNSFFKSLTAALETTLLSASGEVKKSSVETLVAVVISVNSDKRKIFECLVPKVLGALAFFLNAKDDVSSRALIEELIKIVITHPNFFKLHINSVCAAMFQIANSKKMEDSLRQLAMEMLISLCEEAPKLIADVQKFTENIFLLCLDMMLEVPDDLTEWANKYNLNENFEEDDEEEDEITNYEVGLESLDRVSLALGGEHMAGVAVRYIPQFIKDGDWKKKHAGLMAIAQTAEGCRDEYKNNLKELMEIALRFAKDPHPRVRYASIITIAQLCTDFPGLAQKKFHKFIMPSIIETMGDPFWKLQAHAAIAVVNIVDDCDTDYVLPYIEPLFAALLGCLKNGQMFVQIQSLAAISSLCDAAKSGFVKYYDSLIPILKEILKLKNTGRESVIMRSRAIECTSSLIMAVGNEIFAKDSQQIMELLFRSPTGAPINSQDAMKVNYKLDFNDQQTPQLLNAYIKISKCMGKDFIPYLTLILPGLLEVSKQTPKFKVSDLNEEEDKALLADEEEENGDEEEQFEEIDEDDITASDGIKVEDPENKRICVRTQDLEEKSTAIYFIGQFVDEMKEWFYPFAEKVISTFVPLLNYKIYAFVRQNVAEVMPHLLASVKTAYEKKITGEKINQGTLKSLTEYILSSMVESAVEEIEAQTAAILVNSVAECVETAGADLITVETLNKKIQLIKKPIMESFEHIKETYSILKKAENSEEDTKEELREYEGELEDEESLQCCYIELFGTLLKLLPAQFSMIFKEELLPIYCAVLDPAKNSELEIRLGLCTLCDFLENAPQTMGNSYLNLILPAMLRHTESDNHELRQAAVYGIGACSQYGAPNFMTTEILVQCAQQLKKAICRPDARRDEACLATANAVSAIYKIIQYCKDRIPPQTCDELLNFWLNQLPVTGDMIEARIVHNNLMALVNAQNPVIMGPNNSNLPKIIKIFAQIIFTDMSEDKFEEQVLVYFANLQKVLPPNLFSQLVNNLTEEEKENLQKLSKKGK